MKRRILAIAVSVCLLAANGSMTVLAEETDHVLPNERQEEMLLEDAEEMTLSDEELPVLQLADGTMSGQCGDNLTWTLDAQGLLTISGSGKMYGYLSSSPKPWKSSDVKSLKIKEGVTNIGENAFSDCSGVTGDLTIPSSVTKIGAGAFKGCKGFSGDLIIPNGVTSIGGSAFSGCSGFTGDLTIPGSVTSIDSFAFFGCKGFNGKLTIPDSVTRIGGSAFYDCSGFTGDLTIPGSVSIISGLAFSGCSGFTGDLTILSGVTDIDNSAFMGCRGFNGKLILPASVTSIGEYAFSGCSGFSGKLTIPSSVTSIEKSAFSGCSGFSGDLTIPASVTSIGESAFLNCSGFSGKLTIPNSVTNIGRDAFFGCSGFSGDLIIPSSVTSIGSRAFYNCHNVTKFINKSSAVCELPSGSGYYWIEEGKPDVPVKSIASGTAVRVSNTPEPEKPSPSPEPEKPSVNPSIAPPNFGVKGVIGGRTVTFTSDTKGAVIYYSTTTSNLTTSDIKIENGGTVTFENYYGSLYARSYYNGEWSNVSRLILKIPAVNDPTITQEGSKVTIRCSTPDSYVYYTLDGSTPTPENGIKIAPNKSASFEMITGGTVKAIAVRSGFANSKVVEKKIASSVSASVKVPSFKVVGVFGGREVTFTSEPGAIIYYSTSSTMTSNDAHVNSGGSVVFSDFYGTIYARSYKDGKWSNPARLILKIPTINTPTITDHGNGYVTLKTTTPDCYLYYTTDGSTPSMTNGKRIAASASKIYVGTGKTVKVIAVRSCFTNSAVATLKTK